MALGVRNVNSYLVEISYRLVEDICDTTVTEDVSTGVQTVTVASALGMYVGAQIVISGGSNPDSIIMLAALDTSVTPPTITADFANSYPSGSTLYAATFPTQQTTDPLFTQSEMLGYLARAQNEFLSRVPCIFAFADPNPTIQLGKLYQSTPADAIQIARVAIQNGSPSVWTRLYSTTQEQIASRNPQWFYDSGDGVPKAWYEDRTGYYQWGVAPNPGAAFPAEVLYSTRGPDSLTLLDTLLIPDIMGMYVKYQALSYAFSKDGEQRSPSAAKSCQQRFDRGVMICQRYLRGALESAAESQMNGA